MVVVACKRIKRSVLETNALYNVFRTRHDNKFLAYNVKDETAHRYQQCHQHHRTQVDLCFAVVLLSEGNLPMPVSAMPVALRGAVWLHSSGGAAFLSAQPSLYHDTLTAMDEAQEPIPSLVSCSSMYLTEKGAMAFDRIMRVLNYLHQPTRTPWVGYAPENCDRCCLARPCLYV